MNPATLSSATINAYGPTLLACLPPAILHCAAQCVSRDEYKQALQLISCKRQGSKIAIYSTNGHMLFRFVFEQSERFYLSQDLLLSADAFKKKVTYSHYAFIRADGVVEIRGGKVAKSAAADALPPSDLIEAKPWKHAADCYNFPECDRLWPHSFKNAPGEAISMNATYLTTFLKMVESLSPNNVFRFETNGPRNPVAASCDSAIPGITGRLEFLLMPVQVRD
jgi:hypothetical protein